MDGKRQVWFYEDSAARRIVSSLPSDYKLREMAREKKGERTKSIPASTGGARVVWLADLNRDGSSFPRALKRGAPDLRLIGVFESSKRLSHPRKSKVFSYLPLQAPPAVVRQTLASAFESMEVATRDRARCEQLNRAEQETEDLNRIGIALSSEREIGALLDVILHKAREITFADAGSLYIVEEPEPGKRQLRFRLMQNDSLQFPLSEFTLPLTEDSMAGFVALHGEPLNLPNAYKVPHGDPYHFNRRYDQDSGYHTRSLLTLPMCNAKGKVLGVLQLINCKRNPASRLVTASDFAQKVQPFRQRAVRLATSLASQAAVAYENRRLYEEIEILFEGFVRAAVTAIEQRDPTTSGHSFRVSMLTVALAETVDSVICGPYAATHFDRERMKEIRYAALLHDFGKVGVREEILVKAKKLYPFQLELVQQRFDYIKKEIETRAAEQKLKILLEQGREAALRQFPDLEVECARRLKEVDDYLRVIIEINEPTIPSQGNLDRLLEIAQGRYRDPRGIEHLFLRPEEVRFLSIPSGSLDDQERRDIESHVIHTFNFLRQIPWTSEFKDIPAIARAHHEKLNGTGYPAKLRGDEIPLPAKMITICDIFDALVASDRPYKCAVSSERALRILEDSVGNQELDRELFRLFVEAKIFELTVSHKVAAERAHRVSVAC